MGSARWNKFNVDQFKRVFFQRELMQYRNTTEHEDGLVQRENRTLTIAGGQARGELVGGHLSVLVGLAGSKYLPDLAGRILFLEDVEEAPYRLDRLLTTPNPIGAPARIAGFIFGAYTASRPGERYR